MAEDEIARKLGGLGFTVGTFIQLRCVRSSLPRQLSVQFLVAHRITWS
jgi:hypothetical protein